MPRAAFASLVGKLSFFSESMMSARLHMAPLHFLAHRAQELGWPVVVPSLTFGALPALRWWADAAQGGKLKPHPRIDLRSFVGEAEVGTDLATRVAERFALLQTRSDASGDAGWSLWWGSVALWGTWTAAQRAWTIQAKELYPIFQLLRTEGHVGGAAFRRLIVTRTDNLANAFNINSCRTTQADVASAALLRAIYALADQAEAAILALWLPREHNVTADELSKCHFLSDARRSATALGLSVRDISAGEGDDLLAQHYLGLLPEHGAIPGAEGDEQEH
jgi:hypothetical protein